MKQVLWEPTPGAMVAWLLENTNARPIDLFTITLKSGQVFRFSGTDTQVSFNGMTFALGPAFESSGYTQAFGVSVDSLTIKMNARDTDMLGTEPWHAAVARGVLDGATIAVWLMFQDHAGGVQGVVADWIGNVGQADSDRSRITIKVRSWTELLDVNVPGAVYQPNCRNTLYQGRCGLDPAAYSVSGTLATDATNVRRTHVTNSLVVAVKVPYWANLGELRFTSGSNAGISRPVRSHTSTGGTATIEVMYPFPFTSKSGDSFTLRAGCDKTRVQCQTKFNNLVNFRGEPFIPPPETAL